MKKLLSLILVIVLLAAIAPAVLAADGDATAAADRLYELGLFYGTGTNADGTPIYDLNRAPTRAEAVTMLVRLLGKESEAKSGTWKTPFTDVADWAKPYVGYAYANKLTTGTSATTYSGDDPITATQYLTFVLRALGYSDANGDFRWDAAWQLSDQIGLTDGAYNEATNAAFLRGDVAMISSSALDCRLAGTQQTLLEKVQSGVCQHVWPDWTITKLPTATATGMEERVCPICGAKETKIMPIVDVQGSGYTDHWGEEHGNWNTDGDITQAQFDEFVSYAISQGFVFSNSTAYHTDYNLNKSGTIFPSFAITMGRDWNTVLITVWTSPEGVEDDSRHCHNIDQLYEFFDLYKDR